MRWFKTRYVRSLEEAKSKLETENIALRKRVDQLVERLLLKNGSGPTVELPPEPSKEALDKMLQTNSIFDDIDDEPVQTDNIVDNRKEQFDEFVS